MPASKVDAKTIKICRQPGTNSFYAYWSLSDAQKKSTITKNVYKEEKQTVNGKQKTVSKKVSTTKKFIDVIDHFEVRWAYKVIRGSEYAWFYDTTIDVNSNSNSTRNFQLWTPPDNAVSIKMRIQPISKTYQSGANSTSRWFDVGTSEKVDTDYDAYPEAPTISDFEIVINDSGKNVVKANISYKIKNYYGTNTKNLNSVAVQLLYEGNKTINVGTFGTSTVGVTNINHVLSSIGSYQIRARVGAKDTDTNGTLWSEWTEWSSAINTRPTTPKINSCSIVYNANNELGVTVSWDKTSWNNVNHITSYTIEYVQSKNNFDGNNIQSVSGIDKTLNNYTIWNLSPGNTYYFRLKTVNNTMESSPSAVKSIIIGSKPVAPTVWSSLNTVTYIRDDNNSRYDFEDFLIYWSHNANDGSAERKAQIEVTIGTHKYYSIISNTDKNDYGNLEDKVHQCDIFNQFFSTYNSVDNPSTAADAIRLYNAYAFYVDSHGDPEEIKYRVRTKGLFGSDAGENNGYSEWSIENSIKVYAKPSLSLNVNDGLNYTQNIVKIFPINISGMTYPDSQDPISYFISIVANDTYDTDDILGNEQNIVRGTEIFTRYIDINENLNISLGAGDLDLKSGCSYTLNVLAYMDSGLTASASYVFTVEWDEVSEIPECDILYNEKYKYISLRPYCRTYAVPEKDMTEINNLDYSNSITNASNVSHVFDKFAMRDTKSFRFRTLESMNLEFRDGTTQEEINRLYAKYNLDCDLYVVPVPTSIYEDIYQSIPVRVINCNTGEMIHGTTVRRLTNDKDTGDAVSNNYSYFDIGDLRLRVYFEKSDFGDYYYAWKIIDYDEYAIRLKTKTINISNPSFDASTGTMLGGGVSAVMSVTYYMAETFHMLELSEDDYIGKVLLDGISYIFSIYTVAGEKRHALWRDDKEPNENPNSVQYSTYLLSNGVLVDSITLFSVDSNGDANSFSTYNINYDDLNDDVSFSIDFVIINSVAYNFLYRMRPTVPQSYPYSWASGHILLLYPYGMLVTDTDIQKAIDPTVESDNDSIIITSEYDLFKNRGLIVVDGHSFCFVYDNESNITLIPCTVNIFGKNYEIDFSRTDKLYFNITENDELKTYETYYTKKKTITSNKHNSFLTDEWYYEILLPDEHKNLVKFFVNVNAYDISIVPVRSNKIIDFSNVGNGQHGKIVIVPVNNHADTDINNVCFIDPNGGECIWSRNNSSDVFHVNGLWFWTSAISISEDYDIVIDGTGYIDTNSSGHFHIESYEPDSKAYVVNVSDMLDGTCVLMRESEVILCMPGDIIISPNDKKVYAVTDICCSEDDTYNINITNIYKLEFESDVWYYGNSIGNGDIILSASYPDSNIPTANIGDMYLNEDTGDLFKCIKSGNPEEAIWEYIWNMFFIPSKNTSLSVYRKDTNGNYTLLASGIDNNFQNDNSAITIRDPHPSFGEVNYRIVSSNTLNGAIGYADESISTPETSIVIQWDESWQFNNIITNDDGSIFEGYMLELPANIKISDSNSKDMSLVEYIGRERPVAYYGTQKGESLSISCVFPKRDNETLKKLRLLMAYNGDVYIREPSGLGYWASLTISYDRSYDDETIPVSLTVRPVEGGV